MEIYRKDNILFIKGDIKTSTDIEKVKREIENILPNKQQIILNLDSYFLPSSLLGYLIFLNDKEKEICLYIKNDFLFEKLKELGLDDIFFIKKV